MNQKTRHAHCFLDLAVDLLVQLVGFGSGALDISSRIAKKLPLCLRQLGWVVCSFKYAASR